MDYLLHYYWLYMGKTFRIINYLQMGNEYCLATSQGSMIVNELEIDSFECMGKVKKVA